jgi:hypothetical protein
MEPTDTCFICGRPDLAKNLGVWFVKSECRTVHIDCWIDASGKDRDDGESTQQRAS